MKKVTLGVLMAVLFITTNAQDTSSKNKYNLGFEKVNKVLPIGWKSNEKTGYQVAVDSVNTKAGNYSVSIEYKKGAIDFENSYYLISDNYGGKEIKLAGYIKTENVSEGHAGLWMKIDPFQGYVSMEESGVVGSTDWTRYEISLELDPKEKVERQFVLGGYLMGKGKVWFDNFSLTIDGIDVEKIAPILPKAYPADEDKEFDEGSGISISSLDEFQIKNLKQLGLVWGFLKYYHPNIAKGGFNWDYELFRVLPKVLDLQEGQKLDSVFSSWINQLGTYQIGKNFKVKPTELKIAPDLDWIENSDYSEELVAMLSNIKKAKRPQEHYYVGLLPGADNAEFKHENKYASMKFPDAGFRLLALYRYWNIIQYYFPYKNLIEEDWKNVLVEFIPKVVDAKDQLAYELTMLELIGRIHDTHANIWERSEEVKKYFGLYYAPVELNFVENKPVVTGYIDTAYGIATGLIKGDVISAINNKPVDEVVKERLKYTPASNFPTQLRDIAEGLLRTNDSVIEVEYLRNGKLEKTFVKTFSTEQINIYAKYRLKDTAFKMINEDVAYINHAFLNVEDLPVLWDKIKNTKGLIIDDRNYPSFFPLYDLCNYLLPESKPFSKWTAGSIEYPGLFTFVETLEVGKRNKEPYQGKVIILLNERTQSSAEFHAMAYQTHPNALVIGSTTAAADGNVSEFNLPGGIYTLMSGIGAYYPDGRETQRVGITPDIEVKPTIQGIIDGRDELMEKALEVIAEP